jgi:hypothetical protein
MNVSWLSNRTGNLDAPTGLVMSMWNDQQNEKRRLGRATARQAGYAFQYVAEKNPLMLKLSRRAA